MLIVSAIICVAICVGVILVATGCFRSGNDVEITAENKVALALSPIISPRKLYTVRRPNNVSAIRPDTFKNKELTVSMVLASECIFDNQFMYSGDMLEFVDTNGEFTLARVVGAGGLCREDTTGSYVFIPNDILREMVCPYQVQQKLQERTS